MKFSNGSYEKCHKFVIFAQISFSIFAITSANDPSSIFQSHLALNYYMRLILVDHLVDALDIQFHWSTYHTWRVGLMNRSIPGASSRPVSLQLNHTHQLPLLTINAITLICINSIRKCYNTILHYDIIDYVAHNFTSTAIVVCNLVKVHVNLKFQYG